MKNIKENIVREISNFDFEYANLSPATVLEYCNSDPSFKVIFLSPNVPLFCIVWTKELSREICLITFEMSAVVQSKI